MTLRSQIIVDARPGLTRLFEVLQQQAYTLIGPTLRDQVIIYDELQQVDDLPAGWTDVQDGGTYRIIRRNDQAWFGYNLGPRSMKHYLHVPQQPVWRVERVEGKLVFVPAQPVSPKRVNGRNTAGQRTGIFSLCS